MKYFIVLFIGLISTPLFLSAQQLPEGLITLDGYAASVNGRIITVGDVMTAIDPVRKQLARKYKGKELKAKLDEAFKKGLQLLVEREMILEGSDPLIKGSRRNREAQLVIFASGQGEVKGLPLDIPPLDQFRVDGNGFLVQHEPQT